MAYSEDFAMMLKSEKANLVGNLFLPNRNLYMHLENLVKELQNKDRTILLRDFEQLLHELYGVNANANNFAVREEVFEEISKMIAQYLWQNGKNLYTINRNQPDLKEKLTKEFVTGLTATISKKADLASNPIPDLVTMFATEIASTANGTLMMRNKTASSDIKNYIKDLKIVMDRFEVYHGFKWSDGMLVRRLSEDKVIQTYSVFNHIFDDASVELDVDNCKKLGLIITNK